MKHLSDVAGILVAHAPRHQAAKVLELLVSQSKASGGAVLAVRAGQVVLFSISRNLAAARVAAACALWEAHQDALKNVAGSITEGEQILAGIRDERGAVTAAIYLDRPQAFDPSALAAFGVAIAKAIEFEAAGPSLPDESISLLPQGATERERLDSMLTRNEGNIARVARLLGVTRRTIYLRMQRYGIPRVKVPKSNTPRRRAPENSAV